METTYKLIKSYWGDKKQEEISENEFKKYYAKIYKKNTELNNHSENLVLIAKELKYTHFQKIFQNILEIHLLEKHLPLGISEYRYMKLKEMLGFIKNDYPEFYEKIKNSL